METEIVSSDDFVLETISVVNDEYVGGSCTITVKGSLSFPGVGSVEVSVSVTAETCTKAAELAAADLKAVMNTIKKAVKEITEN